MSCNFFVNAMHGLVLKAGYLLEPPKALPVSGSMMTKKLWKHCSVLLKIFTDPLNHLFLLDYIRQQTVIKRS